MKTTILAIVAVTSLLNNPAEVQAATASDRSTINVFAKVGTHGFGAGVGYVINDSFAVRLGLLSGSTFKADRKIDDIRYDIERKTDKALEAMIDWYPLADSGLWVSLGMLLTDTDTHLTGTPNSDGNFIINGNSYTSDEIGDLESRVRPARIAPYLGVGWASSKPGTPGLRFISEAGLIHHRSVRASLTASAAGANDDLLEDLDRERGRIKDVNDFAYQVAIGVSYTF